MAGTTNLKAGGRSETGKQIAKRLRREGKVPAVVYSQSKSLPCSVDSKDFETLMHTEGRNALISLQVEGEGDHTTIIKVIQHHPLRRNVLHIDFQEISLTETVVVEVTVEAVGTPIGVRSEGGILEHRLHRIEVECLPMQIPEKIEVDVSNMAIGDSIHVSDLTVGPDATIVTEGERSILVVVPPSVLKSTDEEDEEAAEAAEGEDAPTEPELVDERGKKDDKDEES